MVMQFDTDEELCFILLKSVAAKYAQPLASLLVFDNPPPSQSHVFDTHETNINASIYTFFFLDHMQQM